MKNKKHILGLLFIMFISTLIYAQPSGPGTTDPSGEPGGPVGTGVPLDGGSLFMLIAGVAYGAKRLKKTGKGLMEKGKG
jgi:hypothetical protein